VKSPKGLRFGKRIRIRGKYRQQVRDQRGKIVGLLAWNQKVRRRVRAAVEVYYGEESASTMQEAGLHIPGWKAVSGALDIETREAIWTKKVWKGTPVPVGTPHLPKKDKSYGYFGAAFEGVKPQRFIKIVDALPTRFLKDKGGNIGFVFVLENAEGTRAEYVYFKDRIDGWGLGSKRLFLSTMWADALMAIAGEFGYGGEMVIISVSLMLGGSAQ